MIRYVEPSSGTSLDPTRDLYIHLIFTEPIYDENGEAITRYLHVDVLARAITLIAGETQTMNSTRSKIAPKEVTGGDTRWLIVFGHDQFEYGSIYELSIEPILFNVNQETFVLPTRNVYQMVQFDKTCSGYGVYDPDLRICFCNNGTHRTGRECAECEQGYDFDLVGSCTEVDTCRADACGCHAKTSPTDPCTPIGECIENHANTANRISCVCPSQYSGPRCNTCAEGHGNYPACTMDCSAVCVHGLCLYGILCNQSKCVNTSRCQCVAGYTGVLCNKCATGYGGYPECVPQCVPPCVNGRCLAGNRCLCDNGWTGDDCGSMRERKSNSLAKSLILTVGLVMLVAVGGIVIIVCKKLKKLNKLIPNQPYDQIEEDLELDDAGGDDESSIGLIETEPETTKLT
eukprot:TRINITY_DN2825_c0_g2_i1.p1 TRINITY_DN2825_c0_g2~~TRINITY_DN2825_c0_g2_i1.p1  ORF type:complete len:402 (+),score=59.59 TRINITY_DN2825_c0_g2_i1:68-1273(+)